MIRVRSRAAGKSVFSRRKRLQGAILALAALTLVVGTACDEEEGARAFRDAAASGLEAGVKSIMDGVIEGMFAVLDIGTDQDGSSSTASP